MVKLMYTNSVNTNKTFLRRVSSIFIWVLAYKSLIDRRVILAREKLRLACTITDKARKREKCSCASKAEYPAYTELEWTNGQFRWAVSSFTGKLLEVS